MTIREIATKLVRMCNEDKADEAVRELYAEDVVSIEGADMEHMPARIQGLEAVIAKGNWWSANHEIHTLTATGPFVGLRDDQFAVKFEMDVTPKDQARMQMSEVALYTVRDGRIVQEEFLYHAE